MKCLGELLDQWHKTRHVPPPPSFKLGSGFDGVVDFEPSTVGVLLGGPGSGKTALALQWTLSAIESDPSLNAAYVCVEIPAPRLLNRLLSHCGQLDYRRVRTRQFAQDDEPKIGTALGRLEAVADRLHLITEPPFTLDAIVDQLSGLDRDPGLIVLDYLQRFRMPATSDRRPDSRELVSDLMTECRELASQGVGVLVLCAANRAGSSNYGKMTIASGRESSEVEYSADSVWAIQVKSHKVGDSTRTLEVLKARDGELTQVPIHFDGQHQSFRVIAASPEDACTIDEDDAWVSELEQMQRRSDP